MVKLEQNYRSTQTILDAANALIANNRGQMPKHLWTDVGEGDPVRVRRWPTSTPRRAGSRPRSSGSSTRACRKSEIAVFYRTNAQARVLDEMLTRAGVGFQVIGGPKFYERAEVKDAIAYLTFLVNPQDATAFTRIANSPRRGIGQTSLSRVLGYANDTGLTVWDAAEGDVPRLTKAAKNAIGRFMDTMNALKERANENGPVAQLLDAVLHQSGLPGRAPRRAHDRGPGPDREPPGARVRGLAVRHERRERRPAGRVPAADVAVRRRGQPPRGRRPRDAR